MIIRTKKASYKSHTAKIMIGVMIMLMLFSFISAWEFDNVGSYNDEDKIYTIQDSLLGISTTSVATLELKTEQKHYVMPGENRLVFEIDVELFEDDYDNFIKNIELIDNRFGSEILRSIVWKYKQNYTDTEDVYELVCSGEKELPNKSIENTCVYEKTGIKEVIRYQWMPLENLDLTKGEITIGAFTEVKPGDDVEWYIEAGGVRLDEWASWTSSMNIDILAYYNFDDAYNATDLIGLYDLDGTITGSPTKATGILGQCYDFDGTNDYISIADGNDLKQKYNFTMNFWVNSDAFANGDVLAGWYKTGASTYTQLRLWGGAGNTDAGDQIELRAYSNSQWVMPSSAGAKFGNNKWIMITYTGNDTGATIYVNGTYITSDSIETGLQQDSSVNFIIGWGEDGGTTKWDGKVDEVGFWNRTLSASEISDLWNGGAGISFAAYPIMTLRTPADDHMTNSGSVAFNCTASLLGKGLNNISLWTNSSGTFEQVNYTTSNGGNIYHVFSTDGYFGWNCYGCNNESLCDFASANRTITIDTLSPTLDNLTYPSGYIDYGYLNENLTLNYTITDIHLDKCWYVYNNSANVSMPCVSGIWNQSSVMSNYQKSITLWANDTAGNQNSTTFTWDYYLFENARTYNTTSLEFSSESFILNVTYNDTLFTSSTGKFVYNSTNDASTSSSDGTNKLFTNTIQVPTISAETIKNFNWEINLTNSSGSELILTRTTTQTITPIYFNVCNQTFNVTYINFTIKDIETDVLINTSLDTTWNLWVGDGSVYSNFSYTNSSGNMSGVSFCSEPSDKLIYTNLEMQFTNDLYANNYYYLDNQNLTNTTKQVTLYMLNDSKATLTVLEVEDNSQQPIEDVIIKIQVYDIGTGEYTDFANAKTAYNGEDIIYLNWYDTFYRFILYQDGVVLETIPSYKISSTPQTFVIGGDTVFAYDKFKEIGHTLTYNNNTDVFTLVFTKPTSVEEGCLRVIRRTYYNDTVICDTCSTSNSATITCDISGQGNGTYIGMFYATGSYEPIDWITIIAHVATNVYDLIGNIDATALSVFMGAVVLGAMMVNAIMGIIALILTLFLSMIIGFSPFNMAELIGIICVGGIIIWLIKR